MVKEETNFTMNCASKASTDYHKSRKGGGALVVFENMQGNTNLVMFTGCQFTSNDAIHGGGLAIISHFPPSMVGPHTLSLVEIHESTFSSNNAYHGLALYLHHISSSDGNGLSMLLSNVEMHNNAPADNTITSTGVVYSYFCSLTLSGCINFTGNQDTVLYLISSQAFASNNSSLIFEKNTLFMEGLW